MFPISFGIEPVSRFVRRDLPYKTNNIGFVVMKLTENDNLEYEKNTI